MKPGGYLPAAAAIFVVAMFLVVRKSPVAALVLAAGCVLVVSITARTIDMAVCAAFPLGTHFLWHLLNALTLYILIIAMMRAGRQINTG